MKKIIRNFFVIQFFILLSLYSQTINFWEKAAEFSTPEAFAKIAAENPKDHSIYIYHGLGKISRTATNGTSWEEITHVGYLQITGTAFAVDANSNLFLVTNKNVIYFFDNQNNWVQLQNWPSNRKINKIKTDSLNNVYIAG